MARWDPSNATLRVNYVCIQNVRAVAQWVFLAKVPFLAYFKHRKGTDLKTHLKHSPGDTDSKYI